MLPNPAITRISNAEGDHSGDLLKENTPSTGKQRQNEYITPPDRAEAAKPLPIRQRSGHLFQDTQDWESAGHSNSNPPERLTGPGRDGGAAMCLISPPREVYERGTSPMGQRRKRDDDICLLPEGLHNLVDIASAMQPHSEIPSLPTADFDGKEEQESEEPPLKRAKQEQDQTHTPPLTCATLSSGGPSPDDSEESRAMPVLEVQAIGALEEQTVDDCTSLHCKEESEDQSPQKRMQIDMRMSQMRMSPMPMLESTKLEQTIPPNQAPVVTQRSQSQSPFPPPPPLVSLPQESTTTHSAVKQQQATQVTNSPSGPTVAALPLSQFPSSFHTSSSSSSSLFSPLSPSSMSMHSNVLSPACSSFPSSSSPGPPFMSSSSSSPHMFYGGPSPAHQPLTPLAPPSRTMNIPKPMPLPQLSDTMVEALRQFSPNGPSSEKDESNAYNTASWEQVFQRCLDVLKRDNMRQKAMALDIGLSGSTLSPMLRSKYKHTKNVHVDVLRSWAWTKDRFFLARAASHAISTGLDLDGVAERIGVTPSTLDQHYKFKVSLTERTTVDTALSKWLQVYKTDRSSRRRVSSPSPTPSYVSPSPPSPLMAGHVSSMHMPGSTGEDLMRVGSGSPRPDHGRNLFGGSDSTEHFRSVTPPNTQGSPALTRAVSPAHGTDPSLRSPSPLNSLSANINPLGLLMMSRPQQFLPLLQNSGRMGGGKGPATWPGLLGQTLQSGIFTPLSLGSTSASSSSSSTSSEADAFSQALHQMSQATHASSMSSMSQATHASSTSTSAQQYGSLTAPASASGGEDASILSGFAQPVSQQQLSLWLGQLQNIPPLFAAKMRAIQAGGLAVPGGGSLGAGLSFTLPDQVQSLPSESTSIDVDMPSVSSNTRSSLSTPPSAPSCDSVLPSSTPFPPVSLEENGPSNSEHNP
eukprot:gb/GEZN01001489.1/.p1 GENE.gb/GEZN01001489.1/~~gb/GEZN01001489.1/.p1  ORF type:complete len:919 (-),score=152.01 gb/GEZN01001489.1/:138-2894(-)